MALGPVDYRRAMAGRMPSARPQATGTSPQVERAAGRPPTTQHGVTTGVTHPITRPAAVMMENNKATTPGENTPQPLRAAAARAQSNPNVTKANAMTVGPRVPAPSPKAAPPPGTSLGSAAMGAPARMMKKGGLVRKGNVSHGKYSKRC